jgi:myo-inositol-1(or 4)-monophosphatase
MVMDWKIQIEKKETRLCITAAQKGARIAYDSLGQRTARTKQDGSIVTESDEKAEEEIISYLQAETNFPVLGEENSKSIDALDSTSYWVVDPIDGTSNYFTGSPLYSTSVSFVEDGEVVDCCVMAPRLASCFYASKGQGAYLNGESLSVTEYSDVETMTGISSGSLRNTALTVLLRMTPNVQQMHTGVLETCFVAAGYVDCCLVSSSNPWDLAAGVLLTKEAGGSVSHLKTQTDSWEEIANSGALFWNGNQKIEDGIFDELTDEEIDKLAQQRPAVGEDEEFEPRLF